VNPGDQVYFRSDDGKRFGLATVVDRGLFVGSYTIEHEGEFRFVTLLQLSAITSVGALKEGSR
jgi:hypothetical protein